MMMMGHILTYDLRCINVNRENMPEVSMAYKTDFDHTQRALGALRAARIQSNKHGIIN